MPPQALPDQSSPSEIFTAIKGVESNLWHLNTEEAAQVLSTTPRESLQAHSARQGAGPSPDDHRIYWKCVDLLAWFDKRQVET